MPKFNFYSQGLRKCGYKSFNIINNTEEFAQEVKYDGFVFYPGCVVREGYSKEDFIAFTYLQPNFNL